MPMTLADEPARSGQKSLAQQVPPVTGTAVDMADVKSRLDSRAGRRRVSNFVAFVTLAEVKTGVV